MTAHRRSIFSVAAAFIGLALAGACVSTSPAPGASASQTQPTAESAIVLTTSASSLAADRRSIELLIELGTPTSLRKAVETATASAGLSKTDAAAFRYAAIETAKLVYPEISGSAERPTDITPTHPLVSAFVDARMGRLAALSASGKPFDEFIIALCIFRNDSVEAGKAVEAAAERFRASGDPSAIVELAAGLAAERRADYAAAGIAFRSSLAVSDECYPAKFGTVRVFLATGHPDRALAALDTLAPQFETGLEWRKLRGAALYKAGRYAEALPVVTNALTEDPFASSLVLMRADMLYRLGAYRQAQPLLDAYGNVDPDNLQYLLLRAKVYEAGFRNRDEAVRLFRRAVELYPDNRDAQTELARLLSGGRDEDRSEALTMAARLAAHDPSNAIAQAILLAEDVRVRNWKSAAARVDALRATDPSFGDYATAFRVYRAAGRQAEAEALAVDWRKKAPESEAAAVAYARVLVDRKERRQAADFIADALAPGGTPAFRSDLLFLQSQIQTNEDAAVASLRASLVENIENVESLAALFDIYYRRGDYQQARFYLKLALSVTPADPDLSRRRNDLSLKGVALP